LSKQAADFFSLGDCQVPMTASRAGVVGGGYLPTDVDAVQRSLDRRSIYSEHQCDLGLRNAGYEQRNHLLDLIGALQALRPVSHCHVAHVVSMASQIEVVWVDACRRVAAVQHIRAGRDRAVIQL